MVEIIPMSFSQFQVEFSIIGHNRVGRATLIRQFSPHTAALIRHQLRKPIQSRVVIRDGEVDLPFKIGRAGPEKSKRDVKRGEVAYWTQGQTLIIFLKNKKTDYPVNIVGSINTGSMPFFDNLRIGRSIKLEMIKPGIDETDYL